MKINSIRHNRIITDPFPDITEAENIENSIRAMMPLTSGIKGFLQNLLTPAKQRTRDAIAGSPNPHKAYMMGYNKAYEEIIAGGPL